MGRVESLPIGPAEKLEGLVLNESWVVTERLRRDPGDTGQSRSSCYRAISRDGVEAFVKAFDFRQDDLAGDTARLERNVREFNHEKNLHEYCNQLRRVTRIFDHGKIVVDDQAVHFLICEFAGKSYRHRLPPGDGSIPASQRLQTLKKIALALDELHRAGVAHQDVKPSNAVCSDDQDVKITDLGSASCLHLPAPPHDDDQVVGQPNYAPYELLFSNSIQNGSWQRRRFGCDAFLLGNLIFTSFVGGSLSTLVLHWLGEDLHPANAKFTYEETLPELTVAHFALIDACLDEVLPPAVAPGVKNLVKRLCHPDCSKRGLGAHDVKRGETSLDLHRSIGILNTLSRRAELEELRLKANLDRKSA